MLRKKAAQMRSSRKDKWSKKVGVLKYCFNIVRLLTLLFVAVDKIWAVLKDLWNHLT